MKNKNTIEYLMSLSKLKEQAHKENDMEFYSILENKFDDLVFKYTIEKLKLANDKSL